MAGKEPDGEEWNSCPGKINMRCCICFQGLKTTTQNKVCFSELGRTIVTTHRKCSKQNGESRMRHKMQAHPPSTKSQEELCGCSPTSLYSAYIPCAAPRIEYRVPLSLSKSTHSSQKSIWEVQLILHTCENLGNKERKGFAWGKEKLPTSSRWTEGPSPNR